MIMQLNKVYSVNTIDRVATELGETVDRIFDLAIDMEPEDGVIWVYGPNDDSVTAFSPFGIENLRECGTACKIDPIIGVIGVQK